ncbi:MAG: hypothetical protein QNJ47_24455 [Nostocaceae cyanobacterium]|nr:hypothetical protein [Nostocaceae cyanobacterium]
MTTTATKSNKQQRKSAKKRQHSPLRMNIGTPMVPVRKRQKKQNHEVLSDWAHAS